MRHRPVPHATLSDLSVQVPPDTSTTILFPTLNLVRQLFTPLPPRPWERNWAGCSSIVSAPRGFHSDTTTPEGGMQVSAGKVPEEGGACQEMCSKAERQGRGGTSSPRPDPALLRLSQPERDPVRLVGLRRPDTATSSAGRLWSKDLERSPPRGASQRRSSVKTRAKK